MNPQDLNVLLSKTLPIALAAGQAVMKVYGQDFGAIEKEDKSPLTEADLASHHLIVDGLSAIDPKFPILSEESKAVPYETRREWHTFWLVDPLDGTKEFIKRNGEFTVNIALIHDGRPVLGIVHAPVLGTTYLAAKGIGAFLDDAQGRRTITANPYSGGTLDVVASRSHAGPETEALIEDLKHKVEDVQLLSIGSSLKLCLVAEGKAHLYPRLGPTMEWDVAAAHAVVQESGATIRAADGRPLAYNKENLLNPFFIVSAPGVPI